METSPEKDFPWELIAESLTGSLSAEGEIQLQQWLSFDTENRKKFLQIEEMWKNGMEDYRYYRMANVTEAWDALQIKIGIRQPEQLKSEVILGDMVQRRLSLRNLLAIAAAFIGVVGFIWFILYRNTPEVYLTALNEQKRIALIDGTVIIMQQETRIEVPRKFNHSERTIIMASGEADFEVAHNVDLPFIVELGTARVKDIGTRFTVHKEDKMIHVAVSSGKVAFVSIATKESREINAGSELTYDVTHQRFGSINAIESSKDFEQLLVFENTPLSEVIVSIQQFYGGKILIDDSIADRKFTAKLYGMPYTTAIQVICKSLGLEYSINDSIYTLKAKAGELQ